MSKNWNRPFMTGAVECGILSISALLTAGFMARAEIGPLISLIVFYFIQALFSFIFLAALRRWFPIRPGLFDPQEDGWTIYRWHLHAFLCENNLVFFYPNALLPAIARQFIARLLGARVGKGLIVLNGQLFDPYLLEVGDEVVVGQDAVILPHRWVGGRLLLGPVRLGRGAVVGARAVLDPGVRVGDHAMVKAMSHVESGSVIENNEVWAGVPARRSSVKGKSPGSGRKKFLGWTDLTIKPALEVVLIALAAGLTGFVLPRSTWFTGVAGLVFLTLVQVGSLQVMTILRWVGRFEAGVYPFHVGSPRTFIWTVYYYLIVMNVFPLYQTRFLPPVGRRWLSQIMGARVGEGSMDGFLYDPYLVQLDDGATIGDESALLPHAMTEEEVILKPVRVGAGAVIGERCLVMPGAVIEHGSRLEALSLLTMDSHMGPNEVWSGIPARKQGIRLPVTVPANTSNKQQGRILFFLIQGVLWLVSATAAYAMGGNSLDGIFLWFVTILHLTSLVACVAARRGFIHGGSSVELTPGQEILWRIHRGLCRSNLYWFSQGFLVPPALRPWCLRLLGARIGKNVWIMGTVHDPFQVTLEQGTRLGPDSLVIPHREEIGRAVLKPVVVGAETDIGSQSVIHGGTRFPPGSVLPPFTNIPEESIVKI
ncbi:MAG: hypothetical protein IPN90_11985 [Elusimicrobia bacterium]|nr:hypothetical protein [Elusimicrobiota bacterium]